MDVVETQREIRRLRYRAERWREMVKHFSDSRTVAALVATATDLERQAGALEMELSAEPDAAAKPVSR